VAVWCDMLGLWRGRKGRKAATALIAPFMAETRRRLGVIPAPAWRDPYIVGFLGMLITLVATRATGPLGPAALASVQKGAWTDITEAEADLVGDEIAFLSAGHDNAFDLGCRNAESFLAALNAVDAHDEADLGIRIAPPTGGDGSGLWVQYFDDFVGGRALAGPQTV
jgi:hypothetical protein